MIFDKAAALLSICPQASFVVIDNQIEWLDTNIPCPSDEEITVEINRLQSEYNSKEYQRNRSLEYPPMSDYLDGIVKNDQAQIDKYIADCQAVKAKYPKGL